MMRGSDYAWVWTRLAVTVGAAFSTAAAMEYVLAPGAFCAPGSGCDQVRARAGLWGAVLPAVGLGGFTTVLILSLLRGRTARRAAQLAAFAGAAIGAALLSAQALWVGAFCGLCVGADTAGLAAGAGALASWRSPAAPRALPAPIHLALFVAAAGFPVAFALTKPPDVPPQIRALWKPGAINVVELSDFECPYCRALHPHLSREIERLGDRVHFVRKSFPLPGHRHAFAAAAAYHCAKRQDAGEAMAHALFAADDLSPAGIRRRARALQLDLAELERCMSDSATAAQIRKDMARIRASGFRGLPTVWINGERIEGFDRAEGAAPYRAALRRAARGEPPGHHPLPWLLWLVPVVLLAGLGLWQRARRT